MPLGWSGIQALQSHLAGKLVGFARNKARNHRPHKTQNEAAFLEADLSYILQKNALLHHPSLSTEQCEEIDQKARNLLAALNEIVNQHLITYYEPERSRSNSRDGTVSPDYDVSFLRKEYPRLGTLIGILDASSDQFGLLCGPGLSLFKLPRGESGGDVRYRVAEWRSLLERLETENGSSWSLRSHSPSQTTPAAVKLSEQSSMLQKRASIVIDALFKEFKRLECGGAHEIKLRLSEKWYTSPSPSAVDMFLSCCQSPGNWHEAQCGKFKLTVEPEREDDVCAAVEISREHSIKLRLLADERGVFNVTDHFPPVITTIDDYKSESLYSLLEQKAFCRLSPKNYWDGTAVDRFDAREKAALALVLSRCLMDFFDQDIDLASHTWNPEVIFFLGPRRADAKAHPIYVSLKPSSSEPKSLDFCKTVRPGHPILLSFAKLLLEIHSGEKIPLEVQSQSAVNIPAWGHMCDYLLEAQRDEASYYLEAVEGCLNLHKFLLRFRAGEAKMTGEDMRRVIYEQVVCKLENALNPERSKRKRSDSISELPPTKRASSIESFDSESYLSEESTAQRSFHVPAKPKSVHYIPTIQTEEPLKASKIPTLRSYMSGSTLNDLEANSIHKGYGDDFPGGSSANQINFAKPSIERQDSIVHGQRSEYASSAAHSMGRDASLYEKYTVAIVCAIEFEMSAFRYMLDAEHPSPPGKEGDSNMYTLGELNGHNIVLACLPGSQGKGAAATVVTHLVRTFTSIRWRFMIGIGGGVPSAKHDIRLGDVVVSMPEGLHGGVVQYDLGKDTDDKFDLKGFLMPPPPLLRSAVVTMQSDHRLKGNKVNAYLSAMIERGERLSVYQRPPEDSDILFRTDYSHDRNKASCQECDRQKLVQRPKRGFEGPEIHYGLIASGDSVMRSAANRNRIIHDIGDILCFEMEAAGLATEHSCIVIRGISDYADSHKNDEWQHYAAATAAACTKDLLHYLVPRVPGFSSSSIYSPA